MKLLSEVRGADGRLDLSALVARIPYAQFLGVHVEERGNEITLVMPFKESLIGNVMLPALH
ncbi:MAG: PaaI family thioesterase, partial [Gammaproteobacteria bacterium]|nr:PaaI family thioesterase [Gammaproteobacteria bacterium]